jgi:uncharacterized protein
MVEDAIIEHFGMDRRFKNIVKRADLRVLAAEQAQVMAPGCADWATEASIDPAPVQVRYLDPTAAKRAFLSRFEKCRNERQNHRS